MADDQSLAYKELARLRWLCEKACCRSCSGCSFTPVHANPTRGAGLFRRCKGCSQFQSVLVGTCFEGLRIDIGELYRLALEYVKQPLTQSPNVLALQRACGGSRTQTEHFVSCVLAAEVAEGRRRNARMSCRGALEGDAHRLRKLFVSERNPHFQDLIFQARRNRVNSGKQTPVQAVWAVHVRIAGLVHRGGKIAIAELPLKAVAKKAPPPVESCLTLLLVVLVFFLFVSHLVRNET
ncbi:unnamed protein product [Symbiodinium natans]|uniref:Uncharacterized protein n=1 Tax=Symbiodinium natans TaxID=878477 RepID=A0A812G4I1_9DINO|nr:unnamed protein product [Symbiodinium natans]